MRQLENLEEINSQVSRILVGAQFDCIRVFSAVWILGFFRSGIAVDLPNEIWASTSGAIHRQKNTTEVNAKQDAILPFPENRASILGDLYLLIGQDVLEASISPSGKLCISFSECKLYFEDDHETFEEVWSLMSDSPDVNADHRWYIYLSDKGRVGATVHV